MAPGVENEELYAALVPKELMAQLAFQAAAAKQASSPTPHPVRSAPDLEKILKDDVGQDFGPTRNPNAAEAKEINGILAELKAETGKNVPKARYAADNTKIFIVEDATADIQSYNPTAITKDKGVITDRETASGIAITTGAMKNPYDASQSLTHDELKAVIAHEYAHQLLALNPELRNDPKYQPNSPQFNKEYEELKVKLQKNPLSPEEIQAMNEQHLTGKAKQDFINEKRQEKLDYFRDEAIADKIALYITKDPAAAKSANEKIEKQNEKIKKDIAGQPGAPEPVKPGDTVPDPHPSNAARDAERDRTVHDMQNAAKPQQPVRQR